MSKKCKIIDPGGTYPDVLLYIDRDVNDVNYCLVIHAVGTVNDEEDIIVQEIIPLKDMQTGQMLINDFSIESAKKWCEKMEIKY